MKSSILGVYCRWVLCTWILCAATTALAKAESPSDVLHRKFDFSDPNQRQTFISELRQRRQPGIDRAAEYLRQTGKPKRWQNGQSICELISIDENGQFIVYTTLNANSAISIAADIVRDDPYYGFTGNGVTVGVWDAGTPRTTHQELTGRITWKDTASPVDNYHSAAVTGTLAATGIVAAAKGMAPLMQIWNYDWNSDDTEMSLVAMGSPGEAGTIQLSNHSYGITSGWFYNYSNSQWEWYGNTSISNTESYLFGLYYTTTKATDEICYNAPYYLPFQAAGNDRGDGRPSAGTTYYINGTTATTFDGTNPKADNWDNGGFDTLLPDACAKNVLTVGGVDDAVTNGIRDLDKAIANSVSSWGPTDDGRIKPDVVANCQSVYTPHHGSDTSYQELTGTSMAAPAAAGAAAQLVGLYGQLFPGQYMRSSTIKGLMIHTADDLGNLGPDYKYGWGLINAEAAVDKILLHKRNPTLLNIKEDAVSRNQTDTYTFQWDGVSPIKATLCWTDPPGDLPFLNNFTLNSTTNKLKVNLNLTTTAPNSVVYNAFVLDPANPNNPATKGSNNKDNVEQVLIDLPPQQGIYTVKVIGTNFSSSYSPRPYSLILSGQSQPAVYDIDGDGTIGLGDLTAITNAWLTNTSTSDIYPALGDGMVDMLDLALLSQVWME